MPEHPPRRLLLNDSPDCPKVELPGRGRSVPAPGGLRQCRCMAEKHTISPTQPRAVIVQWLRRNTVANAMGSQNLACEFPRPICKRDRLAIFFRCKSCSLAAESTTGCEHGRLAKPSGHGGACLGRWTVICKSRSSIQFGSFAQEYAREKGHQKVHQEHCLCHAAFTIGIPGFDYSQWDGVCERWAAESDLQKYGWRGTAYL